ncbi:MAG: cytochrome P450 [Shouchella clausii]|jgi:cytochrome P450
MEAIYYDKKNNKWIVVSNQYSRIILESKKFRTPKVEEMSEDTPSFFLALTIADEKDYKRLKHNFSSYFTKKKVAELKENIFKRHAARILKEQNYGNNAECIHSRIIEPYCTYAIIDMLGLEKNLGKELVTAYRIGNKYAKENNSKGQVYFSYVNHMLKDMINDQTVISTQGYINELKNNEKLTEIEKVSMIIPFIDMLASSKTMELPMLSYKNYKNNKMDNVSLSYIVEESARLLDGLFLSRFALEDFSLDGKVIKSGEKVNVRVSQASKDNSVFKCPNMFQANRHNLSESLSFGVGDHRCLGKNFTVALITTLLEELNKIE